MPQIKIEDLKLSAIESFANSEIYLQDIADEQCQAINGGHIPAPASPATATPPPGFHRGGWSGWFKAQGIFPS